MNSIFKIIGLFFIARKAFGAAATAVVDSFPYEFKRIWVHSFNLNQTVLKAEFSIQNKSGVGLLVKSFQGRLRYGSAAVPVRLARSFDIPPGEKVIATFSVPITNADFISQLGELLQSGSRPSLRVSGELSVGLADGQAVAIPIDQHVPLQLNL